MKIYNIPARNIDALRAEVEKMNHRARKLFQKEISITELGYKDRKQPDGQIYRTYQVQVEGDLPGVSGWRLIAVINHDAAKENIVKVVYGEILPAYYRSASASCDHCKTNRYRTDTFLLGNAAGELKQVGRNCLADFLREGNAENIAAFWEFYFHIIEVCEDAESMEFRGGFGCAMYDLAEFLRYSLICIRAFGWCSVSKANDEGLCATADDAFGLTTGAATKELNKDVQDWLEKNPWTDKDSEYVKGIIAWAKELGGANDYLYNLGVIARAEYVTKKTYKLAASIIMTYRKECEMESEQMQSHHFGTIGKREVFTLILEKVIELAGDYGLTSLHIFHDEKGNRAVWFASGEGMSKIDKNRPHHIKATVKDHSEKKGIAQTILTRCNVVA